MKLHVSPNVLSREIEGFLVILDLQTETYHIIDPVGTSMWKALITQADESTASLLLQDEYAVDRGRLQTDLKAFRNRCLWNGFLQDQKPEARSSSPKYVVEGRRRFLMMNAWSCLFRTVRSLARRGLSQTYQEYMRFSIPDENSRNAAVLLQRALAAFAWAENFFLIKRAPTDCLPRSLALFRFLRWSGLQVEHCIGVQRFPFHAHAWVEHHGRVVNDDPSRISQFKTLARIEA